MAKVEDIWPPRGHWHGVVGQCRENAREQLLSRSWNKRAIAADWPCIPAACGVQRAARASDWPSTPSRSGHVPSIPKGWAESTNHAGVDLAPGNYQEVSP